MRLTMYTAMPLIFTASSDTFTSSANAMPLVGSSQQNSHGREDKLAQTDISSYPADNPWAFDDENSIFGGAVYAQKGAKTPSQAAVLAQAGKQSRMSKAISSERLIPFLT